MINSNLEVDVIYARLEKQGIPEEIAKEVAKDIALERNENNWNLILTKQV